MSPVDAGLVLQVTYDFGVSGTMTKPTPSVSRIVRGEIPPPELIQFLGPHTLVACRYAVPFRLCDLFQAVPPMRSGWTPDALRLALWSVHWCG